MNDDLISRQMAVDALKKEQAYYSHEDGVEIFYEYNHAIEALKNLPSAQSEIVRCSECANRDKWGCPWWKDEARPNDWYCADGERREE